MTGSFDRNPDPLLWVRGRRPGPSCLACVLSILLAAGACAQTRPDSILVHYDDMRAAAAGAPCGFSRWEPRSSEPRIDSPPAEGELVPMLVHGDPGERIDVVFFRSSLYPPMGADDEFPGHCQEVLAELTAFPRYAEHIDRFNIYRLEIDDPEDGCRYLGEPEYLSPACDRDRVRADVMNAFPHFDGDGSGEGRSLDQIIVLYYANSYHECRYARADFFGMVHMPTWSPSIVVHETGHSFGGLGDEYDASHTQPSDPWYPNVASLTPGYTCGEKWGHMMYLPEVRCFQNANGINWYRPTELGCIMRRMNLDHYCPVCAEVVQARLDRFVPVGGERASVGDLKRMFR